MRFGPKKKVIEGVINSGTNLELVNQMADVIAESYYRVVMFSYFFGYFDPNIRSDEQLRTFKEVRESAKKEFNKILIGTEEERRDFYKRRWFWKQKNILVFSIKSKKLFRRIAHGKTVQEGFFGNVKYIIDLSSRSLIKEITIP